MASCGRRWLGASPRGTTTPDKWPFLSPARNHPDSPATHARSFGTPKSNHCEDFSGFKDESLIGLEHVNRNLEPAKQYRGRGGPVGSCQGLGGWNSSYPGF